MLASLPLVFLILIWHAVWARQSDGNLRGALLAAAVLCGALTSAITETLSLFGALTTEAVALCWAAAIGGTFVLKRLLPRGKLVPAQLWSKPSLPSPLDLALLAPIAGVATLTGLLALAAYPNEWDSMSYHLPRVLHWIQNQSVAHYPTNNVRQLFNPPWAGFAILQLTLLGGGERLANLVSWLSMLGSLVGISLLAKQLGATPRGQLFSALCCATIPLGIVEATSTQNDYVAAFWLVCLASALLMLRERTGARAPALAAGASLGLAIATKGSAYVFALPLVVIFLVRLLRASWVICLKQSALIALIALALNAPHYLRNVDLFGSPLAPPRQASRDPNLSVTLTNDELSLPILASNVVRNLSLHLATPLPEVNDILEDEIRKWHTRTGLDVNDPRSTWRDSNQGFSVRKSAQSEDRAAYPLHLLLLVAALIGAVLLGAWQRDGRVPSLGLALLLGFLLFSLLFKWQPAGGHLLLPLFVLGSAVIGLVFQRSAPLLVVFGVALIWLAWPFVADNRLHPLLGDDSVLRRDRLDQYFEARPLLQAPYASAVRFLRRGSCAEIGLLLNWNEWEYPLWMLLGRARAAGGRLEHVAVTANGSGRLEDRWPAFAPCAVIAVREPTEAPTRGTAVDKLEINGRAFRREWVSTDSGRQIEVFLESAAQS